MLKQVKEFDYEGESLLLAKGAKMLCKELANFSGFQFTSTCQQESVSSVLKIFISILLNGTDLEDNDFTDSQVVLTVTQTILLQNLNVTGSAKSDILQFSKLYLFENP